MYKEVIAYTPVKTMMVFQAACIVLGVHRLIANGPEWSADIFTLVFVLTFVLGLLSTLLVDMPGRVAVDAQGVRMTHPWIEWYSWQADWENIEAIQRVNQRWDKRLIRLSELERLVVGE